MARYGRRLQYRKRSKRGTYRKKRRAVRRRADSKLERVVRQELARKMKGPRQKIQVRGVGDITLHSGHDIGKQSYFRVPVTQAIPVQRPPDFAAEDRWRRGNKITVKGVNVRMAIDHADSIRIMGVCYNAKVQDSAVHIDGKPIPSQFMIGKAEDVKNPDGTGARFRLMKVGETGFVTSRDGPFAAVRGVKGELTMDSVDGELFQCRQVQGPGGPVGTIRWKEGKEKKSANVYNEEVHVRGLSRTQDYGKFNGGHTQLDAKYVEVYFDINKEMEFVGEDDQTPVFDHYLEVMMGIQAMCNGGTAPVEVGRLKGVVVDVYYC